MSKALTFDAWKAAGYYVRRGEKSLTENKKGEPTFTRDQVEKSERYDDLDDFGQEY